ncbi:hypothetical protein PUN28_011907 [Cardiocondyla obscurior]|uniref:Uncharacterized protein n=1 Tax=Cardiocondyla obscurior TaxID=286306 RepID=A0AAW2FHD6_9HYME
MKVVKSAKESQQGPKTKPKAGPKSKTKQPADKSVPLVYIRPVAGSPPPQNVAAKGEGTAITTPTATEDDELRFSRWSSDVNMDDINDPEEIVSSDASIRTTASGAAKRTRKNYDRQLKASKKTMWEDDLSTSEDDVASKYLLDETPQAKRGRPITTGKGVAILAIQEKSRELESLRKKIEVMKKIAEGGYDPAEFKGKKRSVMAEKLEKESADMPIRALIKGILRSTKKIDEVATKSKNLKGGFIRSLRESALKIEVGIDAMSKKVLPGNDANDQETAQLRSEIQRLEEELRQAKDAAKMPYPPNPRLSTCEKDSPVFEAMEIEAIEGPSVILPPRNEWPKAIRPAIQGQRKTLSDDEDRVTRQRSKDPPRFSCTKQSDRDVESIIDAKLSVFAKVIKTQMQEMFASFKEQIMPLTSFSNGTQMSAPLAPTSKDGKMGHSMSRKENREASKTRRREAST